MVFIAKDRLLECFRLSVIHLDYMHPKGQILLGCISNFRITY